MRLGIANVRILIVWFIVGNNAIRTIENFKRGKAETRQSRVQYTQPLIRQEMYYSHNTTQDIKV